MESKVKKENLFIFSHICLKSIYEVEIPLFTRSFGIEWMLQLGERTLEANILILTMI